MPVDCDVLIIGAGLAGLLAGTALAAAGKDVLIVERLPYPGGRFTARNIDGFQVPTGAFHMAPFGVKGPLHALITSLGLDVTIQPFPVPGHLWINGAVTPIHKIQDYRHAFSVSENLMLGKLAIMAKLDKTRSPEISFDAWLAKQRQPARVRDLFNAFSQFALGCFSNDLPYYAYRAILKQALRGYHPGLLMGGCGALIQALCRRFAEKGGRLRQGVACASLTFAGDSIVGATVTHRADGRQTIIHCKRLIYTASPACLTEMIPSHLHTQDWTTRAVDAKQSEGIALHFACREPATNREGITFCLGTRRIAGFVQQTLTDPSLAPVGQHLLSVFWVPRSSSLCEELPLAERDLCDVFGVKFPTYSRLLVKGRFHGRWPVNHIRQGYDLPQELPGIKGLFLVGDSYKPLGFPMAEGVAGSVRQCLQTIVL